LTISILGPLPFMFRFESVAFAQSSVLFCHKFRPDDLLI